MTEAARHPEHAFVTLDDIEAARQTILGMIRTTPVEVTELATLADSLGGGIGLNNRYTFAMVQDLVDEVVLLTEAKIAAGIRHCYWQERQIVEGSGAVGASAILAGKGALSGPTMVLLSGGNIDMALHQRVISGEDVDLTQNGR